MMVRIAFRGLARSKGFTATAVATLALAIGANTAIFSLVNAVLLGPLPYPDADRIVQFLFATPGSEGLTLSVPVVAALSRETDVFEAVAAYDFGGPGISITSGGEPEQVTAVHAAAGFFSILRAPMAAGRTFTEEEDRPKAGRFAVLSYALWQRRYQGDASIVGKAISLGGAPHTVTGVLGAGFRTDPPAEIYLPLQADLATATHAFYLRTVGRLREGATVEQANARLRLTFAEFLRKYPAFNPQAGFAVKPAREVRGGDVRTALWVLLAAVSLVLLIACANVANLLLARGAGREHEMAVRTALGGSRARIVAQLLTECALLALAGGAAGLALGTLALRWLVAIHAEAIPGAENVHLDWRVFAFTAALSLGATFVCGLMPALRTSRTGVSGMMAGARGATSRGLSRTGAALVVAEISLAVLLVTGAGLMLRSFAALRQVHPGVRPDRVLTLQMSLQGTRFTNTAEVAALVKRGVERMSAVPGVVSAAACWTLPVELAFGSSFNVEGRPLPENERVHGGTMMRPASPNFLEVFGIPLRRGRFFTESDTAGSQSVAVISEALARKYWPQGDPIGERITIDKHMGPDFAAPPRLIVGIAADVRDLALNQEPAPLVYVPQAQVPDGMTRIDSGILPLTWAIKTAGEPYSMLKSVRRELQLASGGLAVGRARSMKDVVRASTAQSDFNTVLLAAFAALAMTLAAVGTHGLIAFSVEQRRREIGIRAALGASPEALAGMVVAQCLALAATGIALGVAGSAALAGYMQSLIYGVKPWDGLTVLGACGILALVALLAAYRPAKRAALTDPAAALRAQ
ncbi:MAG: ABC transporter permease [Bryobacteraceae bacterium]|nr:ABC transporter permease [Bryobacteraceae bacterium]